MAVKKTTANKAVKTTEKVTKAVEPEVKETKTGWEKGKVYTLRSSHVRSDRTITAGVPVELTEAEYKALKGDIEC